MAVFSATAPALPAEDRKPAPLPRLPARDWPLSSRWQIRAVLPVAVVLLQGLMFFVLVSLSFGDPHRNLVLVVATGGALVICAVTMIVMGYMIGRPMLELQDKIARVREGDLDVNVNFANRTDEIGELGRDFNCMVEQLRESRREIERLHRTQMSRAEHLAVLGELAAGLAHEIRNPLAGIAGVMHVIGNELPAESRSRAVLHEVNGEVEHIASIVSEFLHVARPRQPNYRMADLRATVEHALLFARRQAGGGIAIELQLPPEPVVVEHDVDQIQQVALNLMLNAIQAMKDGGALRVAVERQRDSAGFSVLDNGPGIPPEQLASIFHPFFTTKSNGTGLGLSMVQRIVESHTGSIEVTSDPAAGTLFRVLLPLRRLEPAPEAKKKENPWQPPRS